MYKKIPLLSAFLLLPALVFGSLLVPAQAAKPIIDNGTELSSEQPYLSAQEIGNIFENKAIYGKLEGATPIDIYRFTPTQDGEQTISLLAREQPDVAAKALIILVDPTDATEGQNLGLPLPSPDYHTTVLTSLEIPSNYREPYLFQEFVTVAQQKVTLKKDLVYYMVVLDPYRETTGYAVKLGEGRSWEVSDIFSNFGSWFRLQTNNFAGTSPFIVTPFIFGMVFFLLGLLILVGDLVVEETLAFQANKNKSSGYLLIKMQPISRIFIWVSLWFMALGGYIYFDKVGWVGIPFVLALLFIPILLNMLYHTFSLSPRVSQLEVTKKEATIPFILRKRWFFSSMISLFSLGAFIIFLSIYLT